MPLEVYLTSEENENGKDKLIIKTIQTLKTLVRIKLYKKTENLKAYKIRSKTEIQTRPLRSNTREKEVELSNTWGQT